MFVSGLLAHWQATRSGVSSACMGRRKSSDGAKGRTASWIHVKSCWDENGTENWEAETADREGTGS